MNLLRRQIRSMLTVENRDGGFRATFKLDGSLAILPDHFPEHPILPGVCMIQAVLLAAAMSRGAADCKLRTMKNAKMMQPIEVGDEVMIEGDIAPGGADNFAIKAKLFVAGGRRAEFSLTAALAKANVDEMACAG